MKRLVLALCFLAFLAPQAQAAGQKKKHRTEKSRMPMSENRDGDLKPNEYEVISTDGSITRAYCPYTCAMRGIPQKHCKTWRSQTDKKKCYVQDKRGHSQAIVFK